MDAVTGQILMDVFCDSDSDEEFMGFTPPDNEDFVAERESGMQVGVLSDVADSELR